VRQLFEYTVRSPVSAEGLVQFMVHKAVHYKPAPRITAADKSARAPLLDAPHRVIDSIRVSDVNARVHVVT
jgi:hypothetical protein